MSYSLSTDQAHNYIRGTVIPALVNAGHTVTIPKHPSIQDYWITVNESGHEDCLYLSLGDYGNRRSVQVFESRYLGRRSNFVFKDGAINVDSLLRTVAAKAQVLRAKCRAQANAEKQEQLEIKMHEQNLPMLHSLAQAAGLPVRHEPHMDWPLNIARVISSVECDVQVTPSLRYSGCVCVQFDRRHGKQFHVSPEDAANFLLALGRLKIASKPNTTAEV